MSKQKLNFSIEINAPKEKIWNVLLQDETYRKWTSAFCEGSYAEGNWDEGSKMIFTSQQGEGMLSRIKLHRPNEIITMEHYGMLKNNVEDLESDEAKKWSGSEETYILEPSGSGVKLKVEVDVEDEYAEWFKKAWETALDKVRELSER
ncbi:MAG: SRPBCC domain-containing protein [Ignavibacteria bacterium]|nr:SRPBCC domain-containing protein [Ignavibacteria bacterium]